MEGLNDNSVRRRVQFRRHDGITIDIGGRHMTCARHHGRNPDNAGARAKIENTALRGSFWTIKNMARQREAAAPMIRPVRRIKTLVRLGKARKPASRPGLVQPDLGHGWNGRQGQI